MISTSVNHGFNKLQHETQAGDKENEAAPCLYLQRWRCLLHVSYKKSKCCNNAK